MQHSERTPPVCKRPSNEAPGRINHFRKSELGGLGSSFGVGSSACRTWAIGLFIVSSVRFKEVSARFQDKSAQVDDDFAFALGKFALTPFADCLGD